MGGLIRSLLLSLLLVIIPITGWGQSLPNGTSSTSNGLVEPKESLFFPLLSAADIVGTPDSPIDNSASLKIYDRCMTRMTGRFSPESHKYYCTCSAAATQGNITVGELRTLQKKENRQVGNKAFDKFIHTVMAPCLQTPITDTEYMYCIQYKNNDWRIRYPIPYCRCMSNAMNEYYTKEGEADMMISWTKENSQSYKDPIESLWNNQHYQMQRKIVSDSCAASYMDMYYQEKE